MRLFDYDRASRLMHEAGIDVILASTRHNVAYLSDYWPSVGDDYLLWDPSVAYQIFVGIPQIESKGAFLVTVASDRAALQAIDPWIQDRRYWGPGFYIQHWKEPDPEPGDPIDVVAEALAEKGLDAGCIAVEMRYLGVRYFERLRSRLPTAHFVDAEPTLWALRMVKSQEEIRRAREACRRTAEAWQSVIKQVHAGMTEKELQRAFAQGLACQGVQCEGAYCVFGPSGVSLKHGATIPSDKPLTEGQFIRTDIQGRYEGYLSDMSRVVALGMVTAEMEQAHALVQAMLERLSERIKPGMTGVEVRVIELDMYQGTGYQPVVPYTGHGVGRAVHEPPYLSTKDHTQLTPGMVIAVEPTVNFSHNGDIFICLEDQILITEDGCERLTSRASLESTPFQ